MRWQAYLLKESDPAHFTFFAVPVGACSEGIGSSQQRAEPCQHSIRTAYVGWAENRINQRQFLGVIVRFLAMYVVLTFFLLS